MKKFALAAMLALAPLSVEAATVDFASLDGTIDQAYGDVAGVLDITYEYSLDGGATFAEGGRNWGFGYYGGGGDDTSALIVPVEGASIMQITLQALGGNTFSSFGAALAYWDGIDDYPLTIAAFGNGSALFTSDNTTFPGLIGVGSSGGPWTTVVLQLGNDWNVGYQSVNYELSAVPLPAGGLLLLSALGGLAVLRRRKQG